MVNIELSSLLGWCAMRRLMTTILFFCIAVATATAESHFVRVGATRQVSYEDLDIDSVSGVQTLYGRIVQAAREVCEAFRSMDSLYEEPFKVCYAKVIAAAVAELDNPEIRRLHAQARSGR
jgi:UrcA family protein